MFPVISFKSKSLLLVYDILILIHFTEHRNIFLMVVRYGVMIDNLHITRYFTILD